MDEKSVSSKLIENIVNEFESDNSTQIIKENEMNSESKKNLESKKINVENPYIKIVLGQILVIISIFNGYSCDMIQNSFQMNYPMLLSFFYYFSLFLTYSVIDLKVEKPKMSYIIIAICDSLANFFNIYAFTLINIQFPFIINIACYLWTILLTILFIKEYSYTKYHYIGVIISLVGITCSLLGLIYGEINKGSSFHLQIFSEKKEYLLLGILICIVSSIFYSLSSFFQEILLEDQNIKPYLKWLGAISSIILIIMCAIFGEIDDFFKKDIKDFSMELILFFVLFLISIILFTSFAPKYIQKYSACTFNISLCFQVFWSYILSLIRSENIVS